MPVFSEGSIIRVYVFLQILQRKYQLKKRTRLQNDNLKMHPVERGWSQKLIQMLYQWCAHNYIRILRLLGCQKLSGKFRKPSLVIQSLIYPKELIQKHTYLEPRESVSISGLTPMKPQTPPICLSASIAKNILNIASLWGINPQSSRIVYFGFKY